MIDLDWTDVGTEFGYRIERSDDGGASYSEIDVVAANVASYSDSGLAASTEYFYRVAAYNSGGSTNSDPDSATTFGPPAAIKVHFASLTGASSGGKKWTATATSTVHDTSHSTISGVQVNGSWSGDGSGAGNCTTDVTGTCDISLSLRPKDNSVTFTVSSLGGSGFNHDSNADHSGENSVEINSPSSPKRVASNRELPEALELRQNYPNPFNPTTVIEYGVPETQHVSVSVYNALGVEIARLEDGVQKAGWHQIRFDGAGLSSGMYLAIVRSGSLALTRTMLLAK